MASDRIFGLVVLLTALVYATSAAQIQQGFFADPVGSRTFPYLVSGIAAICGALIAFRPDSDPDWPVLKTFGSIAFSALVLYLFAVSLRPLGFLIPAAIASAILSYQISPNPKQAAVAGIGLSAVLFVIFKYGLGLGLAPFGRALSGLFG